MFARVRPLRSTPSLPVLRPRLAAPTALATLAALAVLAAPAVGCAPASARRASARTTAGIFDRGAGTPAPAEARPDIEALLARESEAKLSDFRVRAADGAVELHVKAAAAPTVKTRKGSDGSASTIVTFSLGSETDVVCNVSGSAMDLAHWVEGIVESMQLSLAEPPHVTVEVAGGRPLFFVDTDGVLVDAKDGKKKRNIAKFAGLHLDRGSVACVHDGIGYRKTFDAVMGHIATKTVTPDAERPSFRSISVVTDDDTVIGFDETRRYRGPKPGEARETHVGSAILSTSTHWTSGDSAWAGVLDARGVVSERSMRRVGKDVVLDMKLERTAPGRYAYEGTVEGAPKKGTFKAPAPLVTHMSRAASLLAFSRDDKKPELVSHHWDEHTPEAPLKEVARRAATPRTLRLEEDGKVYRCELDERGLCATMRKEGSSFFTKTIFAEGAL